MKKDEGEEEENKVDALEADEETKEEYKKNCSSENKGDKRSGGETKP